MRCVVMKPLDGPGGIWFTEGERPEVLIPNEFTGDMLFSAVMPRAPEGLSIWEGTQEGIFLESTFRPLTTIEWEALSQDRNPFTYESEERERMRILASF